MNRLFYAKLAVINIRKNRQTYFPFLLTCIGTIMMFYIMHSVSVNKGLDRIPGSDSLRIVLSMGSVVIGIFSVIFLFYTNSFLIKRRKKELGLYNILGMEKKHIARMLFWETLTISLLSILIGLLGGILFSKLMYLLLLKIINFGVPLGFMVSMESIIVTATLFGITFILILLNNLRQIHLANPIELIKGGQFGEKEPKTKRLLTLFGILCIGAGYYIALTTESPIAAINVFFLAVLLVIFGTYALFVAGSIALLKALRRKRTFYYKPNHFISVSGMIYRMKQNAVGLANICILSTAVLVMLSTTVSLYIGMEDVLRGRYPRNISISSDNVSEDKAAEMDSIVKEEAAKLQIPMENMLRYRYVALSVIQQKNSFVSGSNDIRAINDISIINLIPLKEYNSMENRSDTLGENEVLIYGLRDDYHYDTVVFGDREFNIRKLDHMAVNNEAYSFLYNCYYIITPDLKTLEYIYQNCIYKDEPMEDLSYYFAFDVECDASDEIDLANAIKERIQINTNSGYVESVEESRESFFSLYGGLFFLGIFLGALFIMATVLIIYYKQISEGFDDKSRFDIMKKVGMSSIEVRKSIRSQVLMVFFLPLATAVIHIGFAFKVITKLLAILNLTNITLFAFCTLGTILVFALFYAVVYLLTARVYYRIVSQ